MKSNGIVATTSVIQDVIKTQLGVEAKDIFARHQRVRPSTSDDIPHR